MQFAYGVNDSGTVVGTALGGGVTWSDGAYDTVDLGVDTKSTVPLRINNSGVVAGYLVSSKASRRSVFTYDLASGKSQIYVEYGGASIEALAINAAGLVGGGVFTNQDSFDAFLITPDRSLRIKPAGAQRVMFGGINDEGVIVGSFLFSGVLSGYVRRGARYTTFTVPGAQTTALTGISNSGRMFGSYADAAGVRHAFTFSNGVVTTIDVPGSYAGTTTITGITPQDEVVGFWSDGKLDHGFIQHGQELRIIDVPTTEKDVSTFITGVNAGGTIVGYVYGSAGDTGFVGVCAPGQAPCY